MNAAMIHCVCPGCGKSFVLPAGAAGRKGNCKACGASMVVPNARTSPAPPAASKLPPMRTRRLIADAELMHRAFANHECIRIGSTTGQPPEIYRIEYHVRGLQRDPGQSDPSPCDRHCVDVQLTREYPRQGPMCKMLTPVFHPNIDSAGIICIGDHWTAGERLVDLVIRIGEMLAYQAYNIKSPLNGEAAMWADLNAEKLPVDNRNFHAADSADREKTRSTTGPANPA